MKNKLLVACMILVLSATSNLGFGSGEKPGFETVINDYIDSYMKSDYKKLDHILGDDACVKIPRAEKVIVQTRADLVQSMRTDKGIVQQCTAGGYQVISSSSALVIARVDFKYTNFNQQNFIILEKGDNAQWKITQVCKIFVDNPVKKNQPSGMPDVSASVN